MDGRLDNYASGNRRQGEVFVKVVIILCEAVGVALAVTGALIGALFGG